MDIPPLEGLDEFVETTLANHALDWCCCNGLNMRRTGGRKAGFVHVPVSLLPARLPRESFALVEPLAGSWNELVHVLTRTPEGVAWLHATIESVVGSDPFTRRLYDVAQRVAALRDARAAAADRRRARGRLAHAGRAREVAVETLWYSC